MTPSAYTSTVLARVMEGVEKRRADARRILEDLKSNSGVEKFAKFNKFIEDAVVANAIEKDTREGSVLVRTCDVASIFGMPAVNTQAAYEALVWFLIEAYPINRERSQAPFFFKTGACNSAASIFINYDLRW